MSTGPFLAKGEVKAAGLADAGDFHKKFQDEVKKLPVGLRSAGIAIVDLTSGTPRYATTAQQHIDKHIFSLAKLAPLIAVFRLRERLRNQFATDSAKDSKELIAKIEKAWKPEVEAKVKHRMATPDFPRLDRIFDLSGAAGRWSFNFIGEIASGTAADTAKWKALQKIEDEEYNSDLLSIPKKVIEPLNFMDRLKLTIRMSDNMSAGSVASDVGMAYMFGALTTEGLYTVGSNGGHGLWLSNTYGFDKKNMGVEGSGSKGDLTSGGTAFSIAEYFTRLFHMKSLVDADGCKAMTEILKEKVSEGIGTASVLQRKGGLSKSRVTHSKIGIGWSRSEGCVVEADITTKTGTAKRVRYIAVVLEVATANLPTVINMMDAYVKTANGA